MRGRRNDPLNLWNNGSILARAFLFSSLVAIGPASGLAGEPRAVTEVIDGETLKLSGGEKVRLAGIDVPASSSNAKLRDDIMGTGQDGAVLIAAGKDAAKFLRKLLKGQKVVLEYAAEGKKRSRTRRAYVYHYLDPRLNMEIPKTWHAELAPDPGERQLRVFLNATLVREGLARARNDPPDLKFGALFSKLQEEAKTEKRGMWAAAVLPIVPAAPGIDPRNAEPVQSSKVSR